MIYLDFDGVIVYTWQSICEYYKKQYNTDIIEEKKLKELFKYLDWELVLNKSPKDQHNIKFLQQLSKKSMQNKIQILTKINSEEERVQKILFLKRNNIKLKIITVDFEKSKSDIVDPFNHTLIDDEIRNLDEWEKRGGKAILYTQNNNNCDTDGIPNDKYEIISILSDEIFKSNN